MDESAIADEPAAERPDWRESAPSATQGRRTSSDEPYQTTVERTPDSRREGILAVRHLRKAYKARRVVEDVSMLVRRGEAVGLLGPNGAGKTTLFYMITGLIRPDGGAIELDGHDVTRLPMYRRARLGIGYLPQAADHDGASRQAGLRLHSTIDGRPGSSTPGEHAAAISAGQPRDDIGMVARRMIEQGRFS
jgi:lipopolysaccharide export system ATP-binding protein